MTFITQHTMNIVCYAECSYSNEFLTSQAKGGEFRRRIIWILGIQLLAWHPTDHLKFWITFRTTLHWEVALIFCFSFKNTQNSRQQNFGSKILVSMTFRSKEMLSAFSNPHVRDSDHGPWKSLCHKENPSRFFPFTCRQSRRVLFST